jgi:hypothetical protein
LLDVEQLFVGLSAKKKRFNKLSTGIKRAELHHSDHLFALANVIKLFLSIIYDLKEYARVTGKNLLPCQKFKAPAPAPASYCSSISDKYVL